MPELAKYLYCIIPCQEERPFDMVGLGGDGDRVHTVCYQGLALVVSDSSVKQYETTRTNMMAHEKVTERVMREFTLLPVRFGTVTNSDHPLQDIQKLLVGRNEEFQKLLGDLEDKVELGLKAFWRYEKSIFEEIVNENAAIRRLRNSLAGKPPEAIHFEGIPLGKMVKEALEQKKRREAAKILSPLRPIAYQVQENATLADRIVVNAAFLVAKRREPNFDQAVKQLDEELGHRVAFKYVGPVPPYNFVNIVVNWQE